MCKKCYNNVNKIIKKNVKMLKQNWKNVNKCTKMKTNLKQSKAKLKNVKIYK